MLEFYLPPFHNVRLIIPIIARFMGIHIGINASSTGKWHNIIYIQATLAGWTPFSEITSNKKCCKGVLAKVRGYSGTKDCGPRFKL